MLTTYNHVVVLGTVHSSGPTRRSFGGTIEYAFSSGASEGIMLPLLEVFSHDVTRL